MATRHPFGGQISDWVFTKNSDNIPVFSGGALLQFWNQRVGGSQYTDISQDVDGLTPITNLLSSDGTDGYELGDIPTFYGPPDITSLWVSADGGFRHAISALDSADVAGQAITQVQQHVSQQNPHGTTVDTLNDFAAPGTKVDGSFIAWDQLNSRYTLVSATGLSPASFVQTAGGSTIRIPDGDVTTAAQTIRVPAGTRSTAPDTLQVYWNAGTDGSPVWVQSFGLDAYGQPRAFATADNRVAFKAQRRSAGSTADILQICSESGSPLAWITANGSLRAPNVGRSQPFTVKDTVAAGAGKFFFTNLSGVSLVLKALNFHLDTACTSGTMVFDVKMNGASLYPTGKPQLTTGTQDTGVITAAFTVPVGNRVTVDISGTFAGAKDLTAQLDFS